MRGKRGREGRERERENGRGRRKGYQGRELMSVLRPCGSLSRCQKDCERKEEGRGGKRREGERGRMGKVTRKSLLYILVST